MLKRLLSALAAFSLIAAPVPTWAAADADAPMASFGGIDSQPVLDRENYSGSVKVERTQLLLGVTNSAATVAAYTPSAVSFNQTARLGTTTALGVTDTSRGLLSMWVKGSVSNTTLGITPDANWFAGLVNIACNNSATGTSETAPGICSVWDNASGVYGTLRLNLNDTTGGPAHTLQILKASLWSNTTWQHYLLVWDTNFANGSKQYAIYLNGTKVTGAAATDGSPSFIDNINNAAGWAINSTTTSGSPGSFDIADVMMDTHTTGLVDGSNNYTGSLAAFISGGKPVDLGANCATPLASTPEICLKGTKSGFATNQGTASTALALTNPTGTSSATALLWNAPYGPGGPPAGKPVQQWITASHITGLTSGSTSFATNALANAIVQGDLLLLFVDLIDTSTAIDRGLITPTGWTLLSTTGAALPFHVTTSGNLPGNYAVYWKVAAAGDVTAAGANWTNAPTVSWATTNGNALRSAGFTLVDYTGTNASTPIQTASATMNGGAGNNGVTSAAAASVTPTSTPTLLASASSYAGNAFIATPPGSQELRYRLTDKAGGGNGYTMVSDEALSSTAATGTRTATTSALIPTMSYNIVVGP
jgi:hypothetical protein